jgi:hypothetical protein
MLHLDPESSSITAYRMQDQTAFRDGVMAEGGGLEVADSPADPNANLLCDDNAKIWPVVTCDYDGE